MTQLIIIACYLGLLLFLGLFSSRLFKGTSRDYLLASHSIGPVMLLMSIFGTTMTAFALVGSTGESFKEGVGVYGMLASSSGIVHSLCFFVLGVKLWSLGRKYGYTTQIQYFRDRLQSDRIGILLFPILVGLVIPYLLIGVMASGTTINSITEGAFDSAFAEYDYGIPPWLGSLVICGVVLVYVFFGGMRGTAWANTFQTIVFMILGLVTFTIISDKLGGFQAASEAVQKNNPSRLMRGVAESDQKKYDQSFARWQGLAFYNYAVEHKQFSLTDEQKESAHAALMEQLNAEKLLPPQKTAAEAMLAGKLDLVELSDLEKNRAMLAQDDRGAPESEPAAWSEGVITHHDLRSFPRRGGADKAGGKAMFEKLIGHPKEKKWTRKKAAGVYRATQWAPDEPHGTDPWKFLTYFFVPLSVGMFPHLFQHWLTAKNASSFKLAVVCHPIFIMIVWVPCVLVGVWATSALGPDGTLLFKPHFPANAVLGAIVKSLTTPVLAGFLTAGILAAIMSSLDSQFLCVGTMFTTDIVSHYAGKNRFSDRQIVMIARLFIVAVVAVTYLFSLYEPRRVFTLGVWCFSGFSALFPLIFASLYWKRLTKAGAYACIVAAISVWLYSFIQSGFGAKAGYTLFGVMPVATMVAASAVSMIVVSLLTKPPEEAHLKRFFG